ncbi:MAG: phosphodiester glycosidase family protein [Fimbriimonadaceae bacterium]
MSVMTSALNRLAGLALLTLFTSFAQAQVWEKPVVPGMTYRMEVQNDPKRVIHALKVDPTLFRAESHLARHTVYDSSRNNGRDTTSGMVLQHGAVAGINGDFFQWGNDPGGAPENLTVRGGELIRNPKSGSRAQVLAWGPGIPFQMGEGTWRASVWSNGQEIAPIGALNSRGMRGNVTLFTDTAAEAYCDDEATYVVVRSGPYRLGTVDRLAGTVEEVIRGNRRVRVPYGRFVLAGCGGGRPKIDGLKIGDRVEVAVETSGFDWSRVDHTMGGGPILLVGGTYVGPETEGDSFNDTRHPRTVVGRTSTGEIWYVVIDGRQPESVGASLRESAQIMAALGCADAINLDGGGSSAINALGLTLNRPSGGTERPVANGILLYGVRPVATTAKIELTAPDSVPLDGSGNATVTLDGQAAADRDVIWSCQGAAWIDQTGAIRPLRDGKAEIAALVRGVIVRKTITIGKGEGGR